MQLQISTKLWLINSGLSFCIRKTNFVDNDFPQFVYGRRTLRKGPLKLEVHTYDFLREYSLDIFWKKKVLLVSYRYIIPFTCLLSTPLCGQRTTPKIVNFRAFLTFSVGRISLEIKVFINRILYRDVPKKTISIGSTLIDYNSWRPSIDEQVF